MLDIWQALCGGERPGFQHSTFLSERMTADRNWSLAYMMVRAHQVSGGNLK